MNAEFYQSRHRYQGRSGRNLSNSGRSDVPTPSVRSCSNLSNAARSAGGSSSSHFTISSNQSNLPDCLRDGPFLLLRLVIGTACFVIGTWFCARKWKTGATLLHFEVRLIAGVLNLLAPALPILRLIRSNVSALSGGTGRSQEWRCQCCR